MDEKQQEDWLDRQLREAAPYIDDEGFTARVLQRFPQPRRRRDSLRAVILLGITLLASALAYMLSDGGRFLVIAMARLTELPTLWFFALVLVSGLLLMTGGIIAALSKTSELQL
jgi:anti-sigma factor RsiW